MAYLLTRRAHNASYSDRTAKIGKPIAMLAEALAAARKADGIDITITDSETGQFAKVGQLRYLNGAHHVQLSMPVEWLDSLMR